MVQVAELASKSVQKKSLKLSLICRIHHVIQCHDIIIILNNIILHVPLYNFISHSISKAEGSSANESWRLWTPSKA